MQESALSPQIVPGTRALVFTFAVYRSPPTPNPCDLEPNLNPGELSPRASAPGLLAGSASGRSDRL
eukprot:1075605-Rhodomonas_salina.1